MLPFMNQKRAGGGSVVATHVIKSETEEPLDMNEPSQELLAAAAYLMHAIEQKDVKAMAEALQHAFELCDDDEGIKMHSMSDEY